MASSFQTAPTLAQLAADLDAGRTTSRALVEDCLARIDAASEAVRCAFISVDRRGALRDADASDAQRKEGRAPTPYAGIPISIKDLFDVAGQVSAAGSRLFANAAPASRDAPAVARLRAAGFVFVGRTNMTEFAYSGLGINPHYGTPLNPWDRAGRRVPGGSSSGAAISVVEGMAHAALGTDTGGSCRIPAAFNGLVGYKPTARRVPLEGVVPLAPSLDSVGPIARSVACCATLDQILAGEPSRALEPADLSALNLAVPTTLVHDDVDRDVAEAFDAALSRIAQAGVRLTHIDVPEFAEVAQMNAKGGFPAAESFAFHRTHLPARASEYDPRVLSRILRGQEQNDADVAELVRCRRSIADRVAARIRPYDAILLPAVAIVPPRIPDLETDDAYTRANMLSLRNAGLINVIDGCAISLPIKARGGAPVGLMVAGTSGRDLGVLRMSAALERLLQPE